ncbi:TetR/AcrR family transcriptional regulator [Saccharopolyspora sp. 5N102]|uniref:TetR/AcrR family transcriptional regulator n=1 Tax=Saccharopolyspora sp. 5N102 TaxID=3375155 RepID=UPI0037AABAB9
MAGRTTGAAASGTATPTRRMPRAQRRAQILEAATRSFARGGYRATGLDDVAAEAEVSRMILYQHFDSKADLYRAVLDRACVRLTEAVGDDDFDDTSIPALLRAASEDPDGFRLLFRHAAREPEFRDVVDAIRSASTEIAERHVGEVIPEGAWRDWAARLVPTVAHEAIIAWLDAGQPDPDHAADRISRAIHAVIQAAQSR